MAVITLKLCGFGFCLARHHDLSCIMVHDKMLEEQSVCRIRKHRLDFWRYDSIFRSVIEDFYHGLEMIS